MFSSNLKKIRKYLNMSQEEMSNKTNTSYRAYSSYERGDRNPSLELLKILSENFRVNLNWYFTGKGLMFCNECENTHAFTKNDSPQKNIKDWGKRLAQLLTENNETPYAFSKRTDIKESRIERFILDSEMPTLEEITKIKCNVDISIDELLYGEILEKNTQTEQVSLSTSEILALKQLLNKQS